MKKTWNSPEIEEMDINTTAWTNTSGTEADQYYENCEPLYFS